VDIVALCPDVEAAAAKADRRITTEAAGLATFLLGALLRTDAELARARGGHRRLGAL
jgi:uncharacterized membrane protein (DUF4010 family)